MVYPISNAQKPNFEEIDCYKKKDIKYIIIASYM
jgi:hypothetical protein